MAKFLWTKKQETIGPGPRKGAAMAYDVYNKRTILFGGINAGNIPCSDTWAWNGENWTQIADMGPSARSFHKMSYDLKRNRIVLYGGFDINTNAFGDTWEWDGNSWSQMGYNASIFYSPAICYDKVNNVTLLFSGAQQGSSIFDTHTWGWNGNVWAQLANTGPGTRWNHSMAYDNISKKIILFGGVNSENTGDTWEWNGQEWRKLSELGPGQLNASQMVTTSKGIILFGGSVYDNNVEDVKGNTWLWNGSHWSKILDFGPGARTQHAMTYDRSRKKVVLFGGYFQANQNINAYSLDDTWEGFEQ